MTDITSIPAQSVVMPRIRLDDPRFRYVPACKTDLAETFRRARAELEDTDEAEIRREDARRRRLERDCRYPDPQCGCPLCE